MQINKATKAFGALLLSAFTFVGVASCKERPKPKTSLSTEFRKYWYSGKAEISRYQVKQARYGEIHKGYAIMIFVPEPFLPEKQVKDDDPISSKAITVFKQNRILRFTTGIYDYSIMNSAFINLSSQELIKNTFTAQDWCGHAFSQMNRRGEFEVSIRSYFEDEGDRDYEIPVSLTEDELWTRIRIAPDQIPTGDMKVIPSAQFSRLLHKRQKPEAATLRITEETNRKTLQLKFPTLNRTVRIFFEKGFPHKILGWQDQYKSGWGASAKVLTSEGTLLKTYRGPYWSEHNNKDLPLRKKLLLPPIE